MKYCPTTNYNNGRKVRMRRRKQQTQSDQNGMECSKQHRIDAPLTKLKYGDETM
jgi:hypothetical protein